MSDTPAAPPPRAKISWIALIVGLVIALPLVWVLVRGLSMDPNRMDAPLVGKPAPHFALKRLSDGEVVTLEDLRGKPLLVNFWSTWCIPCRTEHPVLLRGAQHFGQRVQFVGIVYQDRNEVVTAWLNRYGGQGYPTLIDEGTKTGIAYGVYGVPETYFIGSNGVIVDKHVGPLDFPRLAAYIARLK